MGNNKHLVAAGREFAETMSDDTPLIAIAKMMARLSEELDVQTARSEALAAENAGLKQAESNLVRNIINDLGDTEFQYARVQTPDTDAFIRELQAQGVEMFAERQRSFIGKPSKNDAASSYSSREAIKFADQLRSGVSR